MTHAIKSNSQVDCFLSKCMQYKNSFVNNESFESSPLFQKPCFWGFWWTRKSPRRYKPSQRKDFLKFEKSPRCGGLVRARVILGPSHFCSPENIVEICTFTFVV